MTRTAVLVVMFLVSVLFHALALHWPSISVAETPNEHLLFVFVNLWFANESSRSDKWTSWEAGRYLALLGLLTLHQAAVHGYLLGLAISIVDVQGIIQNTVVLISCVVIWVLVMPQQYWTSKAP